MIFAITPEGVFSTLYDFSGPDGQQPGGALLEATDGFFYGVTSAGGGQGFGTIFKISAAGELTTLVPNTLSIGGETIGALVQVTGGDFYGVTTASYGAIYRMTSTGVTTLLYAFNAYYHPGDAAGFQTGLLLDSAGDLYGTNTFGGPGDCDYGAIFRITQDGTLTHLHDFVPGSDGTLFGPLVQGADGPLYGAGSIGGTPGEGVIEEFSRTPVISSCQ